MHRYDTSVVRTPHDDWNVEKARSNRLIAHFMGKGDRMPVSPKLFVKVFDRGRPSRVTIGPGRGWSGL
jgi:hypothetical protein